MAQWINVNQNNRSVVRSSSILCIVRKNWAHAPTASGSYGRLVDWLADKMQVDFEIFKILYRLNYLDFYFV